MRVLCKDRLVGSVTELQSNIRLYHFKAIRLFTVFETLPALFGNAAYINVMSAEVKIARLLECTRGVYLPCNKDHGLDLILFLKH